MKTTKVAIIFFAITLVFTCAALVPISFSTRSLTFHPASVYAENTGSSVSGDATNPQNPGQVPPTSPETCGWRNLSFKACVWYPTVQLIGGGLISLFRLFLNLSASVFNWTFEKTVINLPDTLDALGITNGLETVWGAFRDIANIIIIGVMVYIAIATIIGIEEYGYKRLLAGALIVATLINFSLFFSRFAIDAANIVSYQVYKSITGGNSGMNIGGVITGRAGVTTMTQTSATLGEQFYANGGWNTIAFAIIVCGIMAAFSAVLLYGSFLLVSRGVLLVFLMVSSSVAFASRILPAWKTASYGWDKWLKTLIDAAVFGPLLTFLLWVSLTLLGSASPKGGVGAAIENGIRANGTNGGSWDSLMVSLFTIAFLYISIKVAHEMANKISGFSTAAKVPGFGVGLAGLASSAFLTRTLGIGAAGLGKRWEDKSKDQNKSVLSRQLYSFGAQRAKGVAGSDMNFANSKAAQSATHGTSNFIPDGGGTSGRRDEKAKRAASRAEAMEPSDEQKAAAASGAINAKRAGQAPERTTYEQNTRAAKADLKNLQEQRQDAIKEFERQERAHNKMISEAIASGDTAQEQAHRARLTQITSQHKGSLQQQDQRIEEAHETVKYHEAHTENLNRDLRSVGEKAVENMSAPALAKQIVANSRPIRAFGLRGPAKDDVVANAAAKQARSSDGPKVRSVLNSIVTKPSNP